MSVPRVLERSIVADTLLVSGLSTVVKLAGAAKVAVMARAFGAADNVDAFLIAFLVPALVTETLSGPLSAALVPGFVEARESGSKAVAELIYQGVLSRILILLLAAALVLGLSAPYLLPLLASGFAPAKLRLTHHLLLWLLPVLPLSGLSVAWRARLVADQRFLAAAVAPGMVPLTTIAAILVLGSRWGISALVAGAVGGCVLEEAILAAALLRNGCAVLPRFGAATPALRRIFGQYLPVMAGALVLGSSVLIDQALATRLGSGSVSSLSYGTRLVAVFLSIAATGINTATLPRLSRAAAVADWPRLWGTLRSSGFLVFGAALPITLILIAGSGLLVRVFFQGHMFTAEAAALVNSVQIASFLRIPFSLLLALLSGVLASLRANQLLLFAALAGLAVNTGLDLLLMRRFGIAGISLAGSAAQFVTFLIAAVLLHRALRTRQTAC